MTRMWMTDPSIMCRNHLLGEHKEIHQLLGSLRKKYNIQGYINHNCIEITSIKARHDALVNEMKKRGYNHRSPINITQKEINEHLTTHLTKEQINYKIHKQSSLMDLLNRCEKCKEKFLFNNYMNELKRRGLI